MSHYHAVVWMDHAEAHVLQFTPDKVESTVVHAKGRNRKIHHHRGTLGSGKAPEDLEYFGRVAKSLAGTEQILLTGPANEKKEFKKYLETHARPLAAKIVAVRTSDHPTDGELLKQARKFFVVTGRMRVTR